MIKQNVSKFCTKMVIVLKWEVFVLVHNKLFRLRHVLSDGIPGWKVVL